MKPKKTTVFKIGKPYLSPGFLGSAGTAKHRPYSIGQQIAFVGTLTDGHTTDKYDFTVLAGDGAPTITGGFARWNVINRPQRVGMTVLDGYDPIIMDVPILFDCVAFYDVGGVLADDGSDDQAKRSVRLELNIQKLEWMAGRGSLYTASTSKVGHAGQGDSPLVQVSTSNGDGSDNGLIPASYQTDDLNWVITGLAYDTSPLRELNGNRIRQAVTVTLTEYIGGPGTTFDSAATRAKGRQALTGKYKLFTVTAAHNTIRKIVTFDCHNSSHADAVKVVKANMSDKKLRLNGSVDQDLTKHLPKGTKIRVPLAVVKG